MSGRALITGGAGFIGSHIASRLIGQGTAVRIIDNLSTGRRENLETIGGDHEFVQADIRDRNAVFSALEGVDTVFHLAAEVSVPRSVDDPVATYEINTLGTVNLLQGCLEAGTTRVVFSSSCAVYGDDQQLPKNEAMIPAPLSPYAASKISGEHLMTMYHRLHGLSTVNLRYFNVFGPRQDPGSEYAAVIPKFITLMVDGARPVIFGDGKQTRDFVFVDNVVDANIAAATTPHASGQVFNIGSGSSTDLLALISELRSVLGSDVEPIHEPPRSGDILHSFGDVSLAAAQLDWTPAVGLTEGLSTTARWFADASQRVK